MVAAVVPADVPRWAALGLETREVKWVCAPCGVGEHQNCYGVSECGCGHEAEQQLPDPLPRFDGSDYDPERDDERLGKQLRAIYELMKDGEWRSLARIADITGFPEASISAQLRHLRKKRFGSFRVEKVHLGRGLYEYRVLPPTADREGAQSRT